MKSIYTILLSALALSASVAMGAAPKKALLDPVLKQQIQLHNQNVIWGETAIPFAAPGETITPYADHEEAGYIVFSGSYEFNSFNVKREMVRNLPSDVHVIIYTDQNASGIERIRGQFSDLIDSQRLHVVHIPNSRRGFWSRDGLPIPLNVTHADGSKGLRVVDAKYYHGFEEDQKFAKMFGASLTRHNYYFEGGNFIVNTKGVCITINNSLTTSFPDSLYKDYYGCKELYRLRHTKGIGHADESIRFLNDTTLMTDEPEYVDTFRKAGFRVVMIPRPNRPYETYNNSLLVNNTIFVPIFNQAKDQEALDVYRAEGFNVVGIPTVELSNDGLGSIHCITMTYPKLPLPVILKAMGAVEM